MLLTIAAARASAMRPIIKAPSGPGWLVPFVEAWLRVAGNTRQARQEARQRFLVPLKGQLAQAGLGHLSEIADAEPPHTPRGCPFQAWSLGELIRLDRWVLAEDSAASR